MKKVIVTVALVLVCLISGCVTGKVDFAKPTEQGAIQNSVVINKSKDRVWKEMVPALGREFFVINNLDKESGLINLSYTGDPEKYIDCGRIISTVKNARGERTYDFPGSKAYQEYELNHQGQLFFVARKMNLEGRMNIVIQEIAPNQSQITVNTRYVLSKDMTIADVLGHRQNRTDTISFNTGQKATSPGGKTDCQCNGEFEKTVLGILTGSSQ